jgi:Transglycosylase SLT domain
MTEDRQNANWENSDFDAKERFRKSRSDQTWRQMQSEAAWFDQDYNKKQTFERRRANEEWRQMYGEAAWEDQDHNKKQTFERRRANEEWRQMYGEATWEDQDHNKKQTFLRKRAEQEWREMQRDSREENSDYDKKRRFRQRQEADDRALAEYHNRDFDLRAKAKVRADREAARAAAGGGGGSRLGTFLFGSGGFGGSGAGRLLGGMAKGGAIGVAFELAKQLAMAPQTINQFEQQIIGSSRPYMDLRKSTAAMGRAGGFNSMELQDQLFPNGKPAPDWMKMYGYTSASAMDTLGQYGITPRSSNVAIDRLKNIGMAELMPGMGLSKGQLAGQARTVDTLSGEGTSEAWWYKLREVMTFSTKVGLDHAQVSQNIQAIMQNAASAGAPVIATQSLADAYMGMAGSGAPGMRSGEGVVSALAGMDAQAQRAGVGGSPMFNMALSRYFAANGGMPKDAAGLSTLLDKHNDYAFEQMQATGSGKQLIDAYLGAMKAGNTQMARTYLGQMLVGQPALVQDIAAAGAAGAPDYQKPLIIGALSGAGLPGQLAWSGAPSGGAYSKREIPIPPDINQAIRVGSSNILKPGAYGDILATARYESGFDPRAKGPGTSVGLGQFTDDTWKHMMATYGFTAEQRYDPQSQAWAIGLYEKEIMDKIDAADPQHNLDEHKRRLIMHQAYELGPGTVGALVAGQVPTQYSAERTELARQHAQAKLDYADVTGNNMPTDVTGTEAAGGQAAMTASHQAFGIAAKLGLVAGDNIQAFSGAMDRATRAVIDFTNALVTHPSGVLMPHGVVPPNNRSQSPTNMSPMDGRDASGRLVSPPAQH